MNAGALSEVTRDIVSETKDVIEAQKAKGARGEELALLEADPLKSKLIHHRCLCAFALVF
jgi:hypothetical protein